VLLEGNEEVVGREGEKVEGSKRCADVFAAFRDRRARCARRSYCPLTPGARGPPPAPAGESAGSDPPSPAGGEGRGFVLGGRPGGGAGGAKRCGRCRAEVRATLPAKPECQMPDMRFQTADSRMQIADGQPQHSEMPPLPAAYSLLPTAFCLLPSAYCPYGSGSISPRLPSGRW